MKKVLFIILISSLPALQCSDDTGRAQTLRRSIIGTSRANITKQTPERRYTDAPGTPWQAIKPQQDPSLAKSSAGIKPVSFVPVIPQRHDMPQTPPQVPAKPSSGDIAERIKRVKDQQTKKYKDLGTSTIKFSSSSKSPQSTPPQSPRQARSPLFSVEYPIANPETGKVNRTKEIELVSVNRTGLPVHGDLFDLFIRNGQNEESLIRISQKIPGAHGALTMIPIIPDDKSQFTQTGRDENILRVKPKAILHIAHKNLQKPGEFIVELWPLESLESPGDQSPRKQSLRTLTFIYPGQGIAIANNIIITGKKEDKLEYEAEVWADSADKKFPARFADKSEVADKFSTEN